MKSDYLKECMSEMGNIPLDQFNLAFCRRCGNQECTRSRLNNTFETRVKTWEERLFKNPPRAAEDDPRFNNIRIKKFLPIGQQSYEIHNAQNVPVIPLKEEIVTPPAPTPVQPPIPAPTPVQLTPVQPAPVAPVQPPPPTPVSPPVSSPNIGNTEFNQGTMLGDKSAETILEPGGTFTFGDDD